MDGAQQANDKKVVGTIVRYSRKCIQKARSNKEKEIGKVGVGAKEEEGRKSLRDTCANEELNEVG